MADELKSQPQLAKRHTQLPSPEDPLYLQLQDGEFRLLAVLPSSVPEEGIACRLEVHDVGAAPPYEALSYVWGDPSEASDITVNENVLAVRRNALEALHHLRRPDEERFVWIDAICINQNDVREKSVQVQNMSKIYSLAVRTVVWLGQGFQDVELAFRVAVAIADICRAVAEAQDVAVLDLELQQLTLRSIEADIHARLDGTSAASAPTEKWWGALDGLFAAPWFERIWCVQEVALAQVAVVMADHAVMSAESLGICAIWILSQLVTTDGLLEYFSRPRNLQSCAYSCGELLRIVKTSYIGTAKAQVLLLMLLSETRHLEATDGRDKVYALTGLCRVLSAGGHDSVEVNDTPIYLGGKTSMSESNDEGLAEAKTAQSDPEVVASNSKAQRVANDVFPLAVDYGKSLDQTYLDAAAACASMLDNLDILSYVRHTANSLRPGSAFPSWVPRWDEQLVDNAVNQRIGDSWFQHNWSTFGRDTNASEKFQHFQLDGRNLVVHGLIIGRIARCSAILKSAEVLCSCLVECWNDVIDISTEKGYSVTGSSSAVGRSSSDRDIAMNAEERSRTARQAALTKMVQTWGLGVHLPLSQWIDKLTEEAVAHLLVSFVWAVADAQRVSQTRCKVQPRDIASYLNRNDRAAERDDKAFLDSTYFVMAMGRRILWLKPSERPSKDRSGGSHAAIDYGMGPAVSQVGDVVAVLHGASVPFVLRPDGGKWLLVGECYFEGLMRGELFEEAASGQILADQHEASEFVIH
jgi:hypothetical protein